MCGTEDAVRDFPQRRIKGDDYAKGNSHHPRRFGTCCANSANGRCLRTPPRQKDRPCASERTIPNQQCLCSAGLCWSSRTVAVQRRNLGASGSLISDPSKKSPGTFPGFSRALLLMQDLIANTADSRGIFASDPIMTLAVSEAVAGNKSDDKIKVVGVGSD
jgi:hypothetical protein